MLPGTGWSGLRTDRARPVPVPHSGPGMRTGSVTRRTVAVPVSWERSWCGTGAQGWATVAAAQNSTCIIINRLIRNTIYCITFHLSLTITPFGVKYFQNVSKYSKICVCLVSLRIVSVMVSQLFLSAMSSTPEVPVLLATTSPSTTPPRPRSASVRRGSSSMRRTGPVTSSTPRGPAST